MDASESAQELQVQTQEVTMEGETPSRQVRATVVQAATVMYNTPATLDKVQCVFSFIAEWLHIPHGVLCDTKQCVSPAFFLLFSPAPLILIIAERLLAKAVQLGSQLVVFPEAFIGGYPKGAAFECSVIQASLPSPSSFFSLLLFSPLFSLRLPAERLLAEAAQLGSQLVVFPEAFIGGYPRGASFGVLVGSRTDRGRDEFRRYHASAIDVPGG
ncbi:unnamed protein product [Closterium sp. NIES-54]